MKKLLALAFVLAAAGLTIAGAQTQRQTETYTAPVGEPRRETAQRPPPTATPRPVAGALPRAVRGNPLQMLNPRAPQKYRGAVDDTVTYDQNNPSHITGIILFGIRW